MVSDFFKKYFLFCVVIFLLGAYPVYHYLSPRSQIGIFLNFLVFGALVFVSTVVIIGSISKNNTNFTTMLMASMALKLVFAVIYFLFTYKVFAGQMLIFVGSFFLAYLLFTIFEVLYLAWYIKKVKS
jgi:hypothetical protein